MQTKWGMRPDDVERTSKQECAKEFFWEGWVNMRYPWKKVNTDRRYDIENQFKTSWRKKEREAKSFLGRAPMALLFRLILGLLP